VPVGRKHHGIDAPIVFQKKIRMLGAYRRTMLTGCDQAKQQQHGKSEDGTRVERG